MLAQTLTRPLAVNLCRRTGLPYLPRLTLIAGFLVPCFRLDNMVFLQTVM
jgi:hypothetical protein